jgi:hypothetical protein
MKTAYCHITIFSLLASCCFLLASLSINAQSVSVTAKLDSASIRIGEQTRLHLSIQYHANKNKIQIQWPQLKDTIISKIEIVSTSKIDTVIANKNDSSTFLQTQNVTITSFDSGFYALPPFKFIVNNDTAHPFETEAILLEVKNIRVDTTKDIKDIKQPLHAPFSWKELLPYVYWSLAVVALIILTIYLTKKFSKEKTKQLVENKPKVPPHIQALEELEKLRKANLWQNGKIKQYHSSIADIIRYYIEGRFKIPAMEQTSDEIMANFRSVVIDPESKAKLKQIFLVSDLVKFAKEEPLPIENELSLNNAMDFVKGTLREEVIEKPTNVTGV